MSTKDAVWEALSAVDVSPASRFWIAYSGGIDSTALLHASLEVYGRHRCRAIHVNHGIHPDSGDWARHCSNVCRDLGVKLEVERVSLDPGNVEMKARLQRYEEYLRYLSQGDIVATAHHSDDVVESLIWQILTGRAPVGIAATKPLGEGRVVRPFLGLSKVHLADYVERNELPWVADPSNKDTSLDRNWIRHTLIPLLEARFPDAGTRIKHLQQPSLPKFSKGPLKLGSARITADELRAWLLAYGVTPTTATIEEIARQSRARRDSQPNIRVSRSQSVRRYRDRLHIVSAFEEFVPKCVRPGESLRFPNGTLAWEKSDQGLASTKCFLVSNRRHLTGVELSIRTDNMTKKLSSLFQEHRVAPWLRDGWPLIIESERIVCVPGVATVEGALSASSEHDTFVPRWQPMQD
ncbi:MAG: tRNA lysidine(34) synthetase TilS [Gammaproteobacteria bacterium]|nr:tRNA lysidine(34) synthetase TilS [Gammaproteobacteria bacterium]